jgi:NAD(P)-dependent dehydrogenase (short-subunit alcohol dehydrogenase family)
MRRPENEGVLTELDNVTLHKLDVTDEESIASAVHGILERHGRVDVVLNNAGYALMGPFEAASAADIERQFATNVFGLMNVTRAFVPHFRSNGAGTFLNVSSIGGLITFPMMSLYHSSKWAVEGFSESLSYELRDLGIVVKIVEPGGVDTDFGGRSMTYAAKEGLTAYDETVATFRSNIAKLGIQRSSAEAIAEGIFHAATDGKRQLRYVVGPDAEQFYASRRELGAEGFIAKMHAQIFGGED